MKEGWEYKPAGEIFDITDYVSNGSFASLRENVKYLDHPDYAVLIRLADYSNGFDKKNFVYVSKQSYEFLAKSKLFGGEIIMSNVGSIGKSFLCPKLDCPMTIGPNAILIRSGNNRFFLYYFQSEDFNKKLLSISSRATLKKFNKTNFKTLSIPVPPLSEQQQIVEYLDAQFKRIDALKANAEQQLQAAKDLFQSSIDNFFKLSQSRILKDLVDIINGYAFKSEDFKKDAELKIIKITNVGVGEFIEDDSRINIIHKNLDIAKVYENDIVIALTRTIISSGLKVAIIPRSYNEALLNQRVACLRENKKSSIRYIYYYLSSNSAIKYVLSKVNTLMQPNLSINDLKNMPVPYVNIEEQQNIVAQLDNLSAKVKQLQTNYEQTITLCNDLKQSLLKRIFE